MPEPTPDPTPVTVPGTGGEFDLWVEGVPIDGLLLGPEDCEPYDCQGDFPGADCTPEGFEIILGYREVIDPLAWFDDGDGEWELMGNCCWGELIESECCEDGLPAVIRLEIEGDCDNAGAWNLTYNSGAWINLEATDGPFSGADDVYLQCFEGELLLVFFVGGVNYSFPATITQCDPLIAVVTDIDIPVVGYECTTATLRVGTNSGCEVWGYYQWLNIPASYEVGDEECFPAPEECCLDDPIQLSDIDGGCEWAYDCEISRRLYLLLYDSDLVCLVPEEYWPIDDQVITLDYSGGSWSGKIYCSPFHEIDDDCFITPCEDEMNIVLTPICPGDLPDPPEDVCPGIEFDPPLSECATPVQWWSLVTTANVGYLCTPFTRYHYFCTPCSNDPFTLNPSEIIGSDSPFGSLSCEVSAYIRFMCGNRNARAKVMISE